MARRLRAPRSRPGEGPSAVPGSGARASDGSGPHARQEEGAPPPPRLPRARPVSAQGAGASPLTPPAAPPPPRRPRAPASVPGCGRGRAGWCRRPARRVKVRVGARTGARKVGQMLDRDGDPAAPAPTASPRRRRWWISSGAARVSENPAPRPGRLAGTEPSSHSPNLSLIPLTTTHHDLGQLVRGHSPPVLVTFALREPSPLGHICTFALSASNLENSPYG